GLVGDRVVDGQRAALLLDRRVVVPLPHVAQRGGQAGRLGDGEDPAEALPDVRLAEQADLADFQDGQLGGAGVLVKGAATRQEQQGQQDGEYARRPAPEETAQHGPRQPPKRNQLQAGSSTSPRVTKRARRALRRNTASAAAAERPPGRQFVAAVGGGLAVW